MLGLNFHIFDVFRYQDISSAQPIIVRFDSKNAVPGSTFLFKFSMLLSN